MRRYAQTFLLLSALSIAKGARADDAAMAEARSRFQEGLSLADESKYEEARIKFVQAAAVLKTPAVLFNLASTEQKTAHDVDAIEHYRAFLKAGATDAHITDAMRDKAKANIVELLKKVAQITIEAPDGAKISVDGKALEQSSKDAIAVTPGGHTIEGSWSGRIKSVTIDSVVGQMATAKLDFEAGSPAAPAPAVTPAPTWSTARIATVGGLTAGALAGGVLFFVFRGSAQGNVDDAKGLLGGGSCIGVTNDACARAAELKSDRDSNVTLSTVSIVGGALFAAGAVTAAVLWPKHSSERTARVLPAVGAGYAGVSIHHAF